MINLEQIRGYFPAELRGNATYEKYMLKEYLEDTIAWALRDYFNSLV